MRSTRKPIGAWVKPDTTLKVVSARPSSKKPTCICSLSSGSSTGSTMMCKWLTRCAAETAISVCVSLPAVAARGRLCAVSEAIRDLWACSRFAVQAYHGTPARAYEISAMGWAA